MRKSLSNESTFSDNLDTLDACSRALEPLIEEMLAETAAKAGDRIIRKAFVKIKYADFTRTTRECVCAHPTGEVFQQLLAEAHARRNLPVRLLGTGVRFADEETLAERQPDLFA